jgi:predicted HTH transcriptional regulator
VGVLNDLPTKATAKPRATNASATGGARRRARRNGAAATPRKRAPRGANREAVLRVLQERPGASSGELASVSGVERNTLNGLLARLVKDGEVEKRELPSGRAGYALNDGRSDEPTSATPPDTDRSR